VNVFSRGGTKLSLDEDVFRLVAVDQQQREHQLRALALLSANRGRSAGTPLPPGKGLKGEFVMCLHSVRDWDDPKESTKGYFLPPGTYSVRGVLICPPEIESEPFTLTVVAATSDDAEAINLFDGVPYYAQGAARYPRADLGVLVGNSPDEVRTALERIRNEAPNSAFAKWVSYWKAYHGLETREQAQMAEAVREAKEFAAANPAFPLTDNLLFRLAGKVSKSGQHAEARQIVQRLRTDYPDSDVTEAELKKLESDIAEDGGIQDR
jgi:hypothetical protein